MVREMETIGEKKQGTLYGVGVGPGDPELLTIKALRILESVSYIAHPGKSREDSVALNIVKQVLNNFDEKVILDCPVPMTKEASVLKDAYEHMAVQITKILKTGQDVAFLNIGDPGIYGSFSYLRDAVRSEGFDTGIISGVPSFCAAAALAGIPLCEHGEQLHIIPASYDTKEALLLPGTRVFMKGGSRLLELQAVMKSLKKSGILVEDAGMKTEKVCAIPDEEEHGYLSLAIVKD